MADEGRVRVEVEATAGGSVAHVVLARAEKHNGVDFPMLRAVLRAQRRLRRDRSVRAVIVRGEGPSFCAGLDFKSVLAKPFEAGLMSTQLLWPVRNQFQAWSLGWREVGAPVIAVVHGSAFGAGLQLALGADVRIAAPDTKLSLLEAKWGLVPDMGGPTLLRELVPLDVAKELTMTGRIVSGADAVRLGLVSHVNEDPLGHARRLVAEIVTRSPDAVAAGKFLLQDAWRGGEHRALAAERRWQRKVIGGENQRRAMALGREGERAPGTGDERGPRFGARRIG